MAGGSIGLCDCRLVGFIGSVRLQRYVYTYVHMKYTNRNPTVFVCEATQGFHPQQYVPQSRV